HTPEPIELSAIAADLAELYEPVIDDAGGSMIANIEENLVVHGNRELIGQALTNLIDNAIKYRAEKDPQIQIRGRKREDGSSVELIVQDNGPGIEAKDHDRVLKRFVRLDESRSESGSGLGLSLVSAIMNQHKGSIHFEDAKPGLRAVLSFPLTQAKATRSKKDKT
ncbi:MAG: sensor histidine kinase, partial [Pseudomonadota bacterium]